MAAEQVTKRCHWVPQVYLRAFAADAARKKIWRLGKDAGDPELKAIDKVAVRFHLYVPRGSMGRRDDSFERKLADLESWFDSPLWKQLRDDYVDLEYEPLRKMIGLLAATMFLRNPRQYEFVLSMHGRLVEMFSGPDGPTSSIEINGHTVTLDPGTWPAYRDASDDDLKQFWISGINGAAAEAEIFMAMRWSILFSDQPVFITTDNPVVFLHPSLTFRGINNPETSVVFPIGPTRVLCMDHLHDQPANQYYPLKNGSAAAQNVLMWRYSIEHIFSHQHPDIICGEMVEEAERQGFA